MSTSPPPKPDRAAQRSAHKEAAIARQARQKRFRLLGIAAAAAVLVAAILIVINLQGENSSPGEVIDFASIPQDGNTLGNADAAVTIVEYADYQCPGCGQFATEDFPQIVRDYVATGQLKIEFRAHPFLGGSDLRSSSNESVQAAVAAECARDQASSGNTVTLCSRIRMAKTRAASQAKIFAELRKRLGCI